jgi:hypothetical protein
MQYYLIREIITGMNKFLWKFILRMELIELWY